MTSRAAPPIWEYRAFISIDSETGPNLYLPQMTKMIFVTGGVVSSIGKGVSVASIGRVLKSRGVSVSLMKLDPYLNVDPGTMSPYQHGEVFVTQDGSETDLDLGHYERFVDMNLSRLSNITAGQIYREVISRERRGEFLGGTIQAVPHVTDAIKRRIHKTCRRVPSGRHRGRSRRHRGRHRGSALPRSHPPDAKRGGARQRVLRPSHLPAIHILSRRTEDQAHPAQRPRTARHRYPAGRDSMPLRP